MPFWMKEAVSVSDSHKNRSDLVDRRQLTQSSAISHQCLPVEIRTRLRHHEQHSA